MPPLYTELYSLTHPVYRMVMGVTIKSRILLVIFIISTALYLAAPFSEIAFAQTPVNTSIWQQNIEVIDEGIVDTAELIQDPNCETLSIKYRVVEGILEDSPNGGLLHVPGQEIQVAPQPAERCVASNRQGLFTPGYYSPTANPNQMVEIGTSSVSFTAAPFTNAAIAKIRDSRSGADRISINYNLRFGDLFYKPSGPNRYNLGWDYGTLANPILYTDGQAVLSDGFRISQNGRYAVMQLRSGLVFVRVDLQTQEMTPFYRPSTVVNHPTFAISNDGRYAYTNVDNKVIIHDLSTCDVAYQWDQWVRKLDAAQPAGCSNSGDIREQIRAASEGYIPGRSQTLPNYPGFSPNGSEITLYSSGAAGWKRVVLRANDYVPSAQGYLAMGDSFSSGEGDTEGGTWYEPGTDEQGDSGTFEGRNLCHLSRRSYPYLIAKELDFLSSSVDSEGNSLPVTPLSDGLFHSVACSGAKIHNVVGGIYGEKQDEGNEEAFAYTDNQYLFGETLGLGVWQPGFEKQNNYILGRSDENINRNEYQPEIITLGIGGNDADFGGFISQCLSFFTCEQAQAQSKQAGELGVRIAAQKNRLVDALNKVKMAAPDTRIYIHGYPQFISDREIDPVDEVSSGSPCSFNVRLDLNERQMAVAGVTYMNQVIEAAAKEAGVFYIDIENILDGHKLCDDVDDDQIYVNGITFGNDVSAICVVVNCIGKETYHPNSKAHELYKERLLSATQNLTVAMPLPEETAIPTPPDVFGQIVSEYVIEENALAFSSSIPIVNPGEFASTTETPNILELTQSNLRPFTEIDLRVESDPITIGTYTADGNGEVKATFSLPESLEAGSHTLYLDTVNAYGEEVLFSQQVVVGVSVEDFDGDGVLDDEDSCQFTQNNNTDSDNDGIDDACDTDITQEEPEEPEEPEPEEKPEKSWRERIRSFFQRFFRLFFRWLW